MSLNGAIAEAVVAIRADDSEFRGEVVRGATLSGQKAGAAFGEHFKRRAKVAVGVGAAALFAGLTAGLRTGFGELKDYQSGLSNLRAGLKSTHRQANVTAKGMEALASRIQGYSGQTDDSIVKTEQLLLTFTNIRNEAGKNNKIFDRTTKIAADMAQRLGGDASGAAIQLGKALNDPVKGITALTRVGVSFDDQQKKLIATDVKHGDVLKAQKIILAELNKEFGGSARLYGQTLPGQIDRTTRAYEDITQELATDVLPYALRFTKWVRKDALPGLEDFSGWVKDHKTELEWFGGLVGGLAVGFKALKGVRSIQSLIGKGPLTGVGGSLIGKASPVPVYVTNWGGSPLPGGKGKPAPVPGAGGQRRFPVLPGLTTLTLPLLTSGDSAPGQLHQKRRPLTTSLQNIFDPSGKRDFPMSVYHGGTHFDPTLATDYLLEQGSKKQIQALKELAKTYPVVGDEIKAYHGRQKALNDLLTGPTVAANKKAGDSIKRLPDFWKGAVRVITSDGPRAVGLLEKLGGDLGRGLIRGLEKQIPHATVAGKILVQQTAKAMRIAADAHSPSRVTEALGEDMGDGLIRGLQNREKALRDQIDKMIGTIGRVRGRAQGLFTGVRGGILDNASLLNTPNQSVGGIEDFLRHELRIDRQFEANLALMRKKGYGRGLVTRLGLAGPEQAGNLVRQLAGAKRSDVAEIVELQGKIRRTATRTGEFVRDDVNHLGRKLDRLHDDLSGLRDDLHGVMSEIRGAQHKAAARTDHRGHHHGHHG